MNYNLLIVFIYCLVSSVQPLIAQEYLEREKQWVEASMANMTIDEKIGQMIIVRAYAHGNQAEKKLIENLIQEYHIGGVCFFQGEPLTQVRYTNSFQQLSRIPLFIALDGEWGLGMRHPKTTISFPRNLQLGAIQDEKLIYQLGKEIGRQCKALGINFNFSPVADINNDPGNPVIYERSFGEKKENVTSKAYLMFKGLEDAGVLSCAKHFPGHGDTRVDSHLALPVLTHDRERLEDVEMFPFRRLAAQNIGSIMVGHLHLPALDNRPNRPASLSRPIVTDILRKDLAYQGLIITDGLDMKGVTNFFPSGIAEAEAVLAGNDILLLPENVRLAVQTVKRYIKEGKIPYEQIDESVRRILATKYKLGLFVKPVIPEYEVISYLESLPAQALKAKLVEASITLVKDEEHWIPIQETATINTATLSVNLVKKSAFQDRIDDYTRAHHYQLMVADIGVRGQSLLNTFSQFDRVIVGIHSQIKSRSVNRDLPDELIRFLQNLQSKTKVIIVYFGNPYMASKLESFPSLLLAYDNEIIMQDIAAQSLFGANAISGSLPVQVTKSWIPGHKIERPSLGRLGYALPEQVGLNTLVLKGIDTLMYQMIINRVIPGGQVVVSKNGKIVWQKEYGSVVPGGKKVTRNTIYDVASLTKVLSTTLATMKLYDENRISLQRPLKFFISDLIGTNKAEMTLENVMSHQSGLKAFIPFYEETMISKGKNRVLDTSLYKRTFSPEFSIPVAEKLFLRTDYRDSIWNKIYQSELRSNTKYRYSDLGFFLTQKVVEEVSRIPLDSFVYRHFYDPLDLMFTRYKPLDKIPQSQIAPSEMDTYFRMSTLQGNVHDMAAAMLGGVAGHAGLFSTATETTILMQMLLNGGSYGGKQYLSPETIDLFTLRRQNSTRRGLGFDLKELNTKKLENMSELAPDETFGHTGFTGSATFADPKNEIICTFLTNRTYPTMRNNTLHDKKYRARLHSLIYKALIP